ncbi:MAG: hypothetical protein ACOCV2_08010, partial [Persicimonas sp.]
MPLVVEIMLGGVALPAVLSAIFLVLAWRPWDGDKTATRAGFWGGALGLAVGYLAAHVFIAGVPDVVPSDDVDWMAHMALLAGVVGLLESKFYRSRAATLIGRTVAIAATFWLTLGFMVEHHWEGTTGLLIIGLLTIATLEMVIILDKAAERRRGALVPLAMTILAAGAAVTL